MGDLNQYFNRSEFTCKCGCGFNTVDTKLLEVITSVRKHFGQPVTITSGCRCLVYNRAVGGTKTSQHLLGRAADIQVRHIAPNAVQEFLADTPGGLGRYATFTHIDSRSTKERWEG